MCVCFIGNFLYFQSCSKMIPILADLYWNTIGTFLEDIPILLPNMGDHWCFFG